MRSRPRSAGDRLAVLAGARLDLLRVAPGARAKYVALGGVLVSTGALAALSMAFAVHMALGAWWAVAVLIGLGWGLVILNLDRMLLVGMGHDPSWRRNLGLALPRLALAVVLGTVISTPLTLQVFSKEVDATIVTLQAEAAEQFTDELDADARYAQIPMLTQSIAEDQAVVASGGATDPNADPRVAAAEAERDSKKAVYDAATGRFDELQAKAQCELDGTCGSGDEGQGAAYFAAAAAAGQQAAVRETAKAELDAAEAALQQTRTTAEEDAVGAAARSVALAKAALVTDQAELSRLTGARLAEQAAFEAENSQSDGILARLEAIDRLSEERPMAHLAHVMLFLLFLSVEILPVLMKTLMNFAPPTAYDRLLKVRDDEEVEAEEIRRDGRQRAQQARADLIVAAETDRMAREILDRELAAREEAARAAERKARRKEARSLRGLARRIAGRRPAVAEPALIEPTLETIEPMLDTGELEAMMAAPSGVSLYGTSSVPAPRPAAELLQPLTEDR
ncbi:MULTISPECIES: DUF4407 domain-containing protein [unclassified Modestobacter]|uniref:DUF4407 domain-containing protein n=1 Tax=unclassified Modestobacter TaxID=2643866 RepID=UPI0022AB496A|nr:MULTISPECIES: DUF4407 domain-containing protein [unclassified Modestobacter]MCZ2826716.1 DUF4407 domain-containing protein [Modestobacter sp. VKM Ac-2981]MCZ2855096.1 DUF4407 domain-containing protein [Modestobacter sp. VKM Ac-2982]